MVDRARRDHSKPLLTKVRVERKRGLHAVAAHHVKAHDIDQAHLPAITATQLREGFVMSGLIDPHHLEGTAVVGELQRGCKPQAVLQERNRLGDDVVVDQQDLAVADQRVQLGRGTPVVTIGAIGEGVDRGRIEEGHLRRRKRRPAAAASAASWASETGRVGRSDERPDPTKLGRPAGDALGRSAPASVSRITADMDLRPSNARRRTSSYVSESSWTCVRFMGSA